MLPLPDEDGPKGVDLRHAPEKKQMKKTHLLIRIGWQHE